MTTHQTHFKELFDHGKKLRSRYLNTLAARVLFDEFNKLSAIGVVGKRNAESNVKIFNVYAYFFLTSKEALRCYFLIELAKFFDEGKRNQALSIQYVIDYANNHVENFSVEEFHKFYPDRTIIPELFKSFKALSVHDLRKLKDRLRRNKDVILRLKKYRDKFLAHDDIKKNDILITKKNIDTLLNIVKDTIDLLYHKLEFSVNSYKNFEEDPALQINHLLQVLKDHENQRLDSLEKTYGIMIKR
jgi:hypothetical protein